MKILALLLLGIALASCAKKSTPANTSSGGDSVFTTFYPTTYFAERISGGLVSVICPLPDDEDPIFWQPSREALASYQSAGLIVLNGAGFEKWVEKASLPTSRVIESCELPDKMLIRYEEATVHKHGPGGEHAHEGVDGHTWVDPTLALQQANSIRDAMSDRWPEHSATFEKNSAALASDLGALNERLKQISPPALLASHPAYNYLARQYDWDIDNLDLDPETMPSPEQIADIRQRLATRPVKVLLWEGEPLPEIAAKLREELGLESVLFSPCETAPESGDYLTVMRANLDRLANAGKP